MRLINEFRRLLASCALIAVYALTPKQDAESVAAIGLLIVAMKGTHEDWS